MHISPDASLVPLRLLPTAPKATLVSQTGAGLAPRTGIKESFTYDKCMSQISRNVFYLWNWGKTYELPLLMLGLSIICGTCGTRRSSWVNLFLWDGCVDSHSGTVGSPVSWSLISICCQNTGPARTSAQACGGNTQTRTMGSEAHTHTQCGVPLPCAEMKVLAVESSQFSWPTVPPSVLQTDYKVGQQQLHKITVDLWC